MGDREKQYRHRNQSSAESDEAPTKPPRTKKFLAPFVLTFFVSFATWLVLSGKFDLFHISLGIIACIIVAYYSGDLLFSAPVTGDLPKLWLRFIQYLPWLLYQVFLANIHVLYLILHPRMMELIDPRIIRFNSRLKHEMSHLIFANSITLTPGTITVYVTIYGEYRVHVIDKKSGQSLPGKMEQRVARIMGE
jgi:multicomponent Na+:H+ antiporter subunit E